VAAFRRVNSIPKESAAASRFFFEVKRKAFWYEFVQVVEIDGLRAVTHEHLVEPRRGG
jgi:hypothetical protein